jgi:dTDP-4-amino-4,6-dideoxygalactose transaminase
MPLMQTGEGKIVLFHPFVPPEAIAEVTDTLKSRWIGQGPKVERFEAEISAHDGEGHPAIAVGSGTDALHLAYKLCDIDENSEVIAPIFTCTATNIPFLYERAKIKFVDIQPDSMNIDVAAIEGLITERTKAISVVHYGGLPCDLDTLNALEKKYGIPVIQDGAHALGLRWRDRGMAHWSSYTMYSFQAIKHITTADGGMLIVNSSDPELLKRGRRVRWFGIDREKKQGGIWENDIVDIGYKYQMTDLGASLGLASIPHIDALVEHRRKLLAIYEKGLKDIPGIQYYSGSVLNENGQYRHAAWLCTVLAERRLDLQRKLYERGIETNQVHYRNDRYSIFKEYTKGQSFPNMDKVEDNYLVLPVHHLVTEENAAFICDTIRQGW